MWSCVAAPVHGAESRATARDPVGVSKISTCVKCPCDRCARVAAPPNHSTAVTNLRRKPIQDARLDLTRARFAFEFVTFGKVPKSAIIDDRFTLFTSKRTHGPSTRRYHPQRLCEAGNMYSFHSNGPGDPQTEKCGLPLFERRKILINGQNPRHELPRLQDC